jgi:hypothetical protein
LVAFIALHHYLSVMSVLVSGLASAAALPVRIDRMPLDAALTDDGKFSLAATLWHRDQAEGGARRFAAEMRRLFAPDPAHVIDTAAAALPDWRVIDFVPHPFVLDGEDASDLCLGAIRQVPARMAAEQTYGLLVAEGLPACFAVAAGSQVYRRAMFPFRAADGRVTRVATLIRPLSGRMAPPAH